MPKIMLKKCDGALIWRVVVTKYLNIRKRKINLHKRDDRSTFRHKTHKSPLTQFRDSVADLWEGRG